MDDSKVPVEPYTLVKTNIINSIRINVNNIVLFTSVTVGVTLFDENSVPVDNRRLVLSGTDYTNWSNDDTYIVDYVLNALGLTQLPSSQVAVN
jgi:hypothetical protein